MKNESQFDDLNKKIQSLKKNDKNFETSNNLQNELFLKENEIKIKKFKLKKIEQVPLYVNYCKFINLNKN